ncbi:MAG: RNA pseudouridine synthase [Firmicutes bacterium]|jgi:23S rRNA pseudouridine1911/1915/1917 synthase|nr:RNA pseudouridine synthase [Bacillota bacterium]
MTHIRILAEDNHILVVEKPPNVLSQGDRTGDLDLLSILKQDIKVRYDKPGNVYLGLVHRLDRPVGGVMVFAKTSKAAKRLGEQLRNHQIERGYLAIVRGILEQEKGRLVHYLKKDPKSLKVKAVGKKEGKEAILTYELLGVTNEVNNQFSLVRVNLITGRSHQVRVQFATIGHSLLGDRLYSNIPQDSQFQLALWAYKLSFNHPTLKSHLTFKCYPQNIKPWNIFPTIMGAFKENDR